MARNITFSPALKPKSRGRRAAAIVAALTIAGVLSGCVVAPAPGYYHPHRYYYYW